MDPALITLAAGAAQELVKLMATDGWQLVRDRFARLLGRGDDQRAARQAEQLDAAHSEVVAGTVEPPALAGRWQGRFESLLDEHPELAAELSALLQELRAAAPATTVTASDHGIAAGGNISISGTHGGVAAGVIHGSVSTGGYPPPPGPA